MPSLSPSRLAVSLDISLPEFNNTCFTGKLTIPIQQTQINTQVYQLVLSLKKEELLLTLIGEVMEDVSDEGDVGIP